MALATAPQGNFERRVLGGAVQRIREAYGLALSPVAQKAGISAGYWCNIEKGRKHPPIATMIRMAQALGVGLDDISFVIDRDAA